MSEWRKAAIGELIEYQKGFAFKSEDYHQSGIPIVRVSNFTDRSIDLSDCLYVLSAEVHKFESVRLKKEDVIIATVGSWPNNPASVVGKTVRVPEEADGALLNQNTVRLRSNGNINQSYLFYRLKNSDFQHWIVSGARGSASQASITIQSVFDFKFYLPPLPTQRRIAEILGRLDDKIEVNRRINRTLEAMAQALFKHHFVDFGPYQDGEFVESELGLIPEGWGVKSLPEIIEVNPPRRLSKGDVAPYLEMSNMPTSSSRALDWYDRPFNSGMRFINGDVLFARITPCLEHGKTAFVDFLEDNQVGWGSTEYIVLRSKPPLPVEFAYFLARSEDFRTFAIQRMTGSSGRQRVAATSLDQYSLPVPPKDSLRKFALTAKKHLEMVKRLDEENRKLAEIRDYLLPKLLSGQVKVEDLESSVISQSA